MAESQGRRVTKRQSEESQDGDNTRQPSVGREEGVDLKAVDECDQHEMRLTKDIVDEALAVLSSEGKNDAGKEESVRSLNDEKGKFVL